LFYRKDKEAYGLHPTTYFLKYAPKKIKKKSCWDWFFTCGKYLVNQKDISHE
jgi:hypothetical protein